MAGRKYTEEQLAARREYTQAWRLRNKDRIRAYEAKYTKRRSTLALKRRRAARVAVRDGIMPAKRRRPTSAQLERKRIYQRGYRLRMIAANPNWQRDKMREYAAKNPGYWSAIAQQRRIRLGMQVFARTCAAARARLATNPSNSPSDHATTNPTMLVPSTCGGHNGLRVGGGR